ncbi:MAG: hypothetical protein KAJ40_08850 [Alphaproteobacteria bacterium]|nr:hypothetical protein [Alphaproteobacteria bacterium]
MAFSTLPDSLIQVGKAITRTLFKTYVKDNLDDLDSRMTTIEGSASKIIIFDEVVINASSLGSTITGLDVYRAASAYDLTDAKVYIFTKDGLGGTLEIDIQKSSSADFTSSVSVFTTKPSIVYSGASDYDESANTVFDATNKSILAGDYLRLDVTSLPTGGSIGKFGVYLIGEAS